MLLGMYVSSPPYVAYKIDKKDILHREVNLYIYKRNGLLQLWPSFTCFSFVWSNFFWLIYMDGHVVTTSHVGVVDSELVDTTCSCLYAVVYMPSTYHRIEIKHLRGEVGHWRIVSLQQLDCTREGLCVFHKLYSQWAALAFIVLIRVLSYNHYPVTPVIRWKGCSWSF